MTIVYHYLQVRAPAQTVLALAGIDQTLADIALSGPFSYIAVAVSSNLAFSGWTMSLIAAERLVNFIEKSALAGRRLRAKPPRD